MQEIIYFTNRQTDIKHEKEKKNLAECHCWRLHLKSFLPRKDQVRKKKSANFFLLFVFYT